MNIFLTLGKCSPSNGMIFSGKVSKNIDTSSVFMTKCQKKLTLLWIFAKSVKKN